VPSLLGATILRVGGGEGQGSPLIRLNTGSVQTALTVQRTGSSSETGVPSLLWKGTNASNTVTVTRGAVGIAYRGTDAATVATLSVGFESGEQTDANVDVGAGTTLTTLAMQGGTVKVGCASTTITKNNGTLTVLGTGACTTLRNWKGTCNYRSSGTVTNLFCGAASLDFRADMRAKTITNADIYAGASILDPQAVVTWTNGVDLNGCGMDEVTLNLGKNIRLTPAGL
jgi:hypothetical protein